MLDINDHLDNLIRHIELVRNNCVILGKKLIRRGEKDFGRLLIAKGFQHDISKFYGIEWNYLHAGKDTPKEQLALAVEQHIETNDHHPEYWGGFQNMPRLAVCEFSCDILARSQEFSTNVFDWLTDTGIEKFHIDINSEEYKWLIEYLEMLTESTFVK
jgi:hypothetical protein